MATSTQLLISLLNDNNLNLNDNPNNDLNGVLNDLKLNLNLNLNKIKKTTNKKLEISDIDELDKIKHNLEICIQIINEIKIFASGVHSMKLALEYKHYEEILINLKGLQTMKSAMKQYEHLSKVKFILDEYNQLRIDIKNGCNRDIDLVVSNNGFII